MIQKPKLHESMDKFIKKPVDPKKAPFLDALFNMKNNKTSLDQIKKTLQSGGLKSLQQCDDLGNNAYHYAIVCDLLDVFEALLTFEVEKSNSSNSNNNNKPIYSLANKRGETPMHMICFIGSFDKNKISNSQTPAEKREDERGQRTKEFLTLFFSKTKIEGQGVLNFSVNPQDNSGISPLHILAANGYVSSLRLIFPLLDKKSLNCLDSDQNTALHYASHMGNEITTSFLVGKEIDVNAENKNHKSAMHLAIDQKNQDVCLILAANGGDVSLCYQYGNPQRVKENELEKISKLDRFGFIDEKKATPPPSPSNKKEIKDRKKKDEMKKKAMELERHRELKWVQMVKSPEEWDKFLKRHPKELRERIFLGLPDSLRSECWKLLTNVREIQEKHKTTFLNYDSLKFLPSKESYQIDLDINRSARTHIMFNERFGVGQTKLFNVLKAYSLFDPELSYCQGMSDLTAFLLMYVPETDAFWMLVNLIQEKKYGLRSRMLAGFPGLEESWYVYERLLEKQLPRLFKHFVKFFSRKKYQILFLLSLKECEC